MFLYFYLKTFFNPYIILSSSKAIQTLNDFNKLYPKVLTIEVNLDLDKRLKEYYSAKVDPQFVICWRGKEFNRMIGYNIDTLKNKFDE